MCEGDWSDGLEMEDEDLSSENVRFELRCK